MPGMMGLLLNNLAFQGAQGGGAGPFAPTDVDGLALWFDASDATTLFQDAAMTTPAQADDDRVGGWKDKSGNSRHFTQATADKRGTLKTGVLNGLPVVRFDGVDDYLGRIESFLTGTSGVYIAVTATNDATKPDQSVICSAPRVDGLLRPNTTAFCIQAPGGRVDAPPGPGPNGTFRVMEWGSTGAAYFIRANGVTLPLTVINGTNNGAWWGDVAAHSRTSLGCYDYGGQASFLKGDIAEVLVFDPLPSADDLTLVRAYLAAKWGITLP